MGRRTEILVSATEPPVIRALGEVSSVCETYGADILFVSGRGLVAVQRKEVDDLVASLRDGRVGTLLDKMGQAEVTTAVMLIEGQFWFEKGEAPPRQGVFSVGEWEGFEVSVQLQGLVLVRTRSLSQTVRRLPQLETYFEHGTTESLFRVPKVRGVPGRLRPLMACDGVSLTRARAIDEAGISLSWSCTEAEMAAVPKLGKVTARRLGTHIRYREVRDDE